VHATDESERRAASALLGGGLARRADELRERLADLRALLEASLDFDEAETGHVPEAELALGLDEVARALAEASDWEERREPPAGAPRIALAGAPNAGKSTLYNALLARGPSAPARGAAGHAPALVSELAGTTRDGASAALELEGVTCTLSDAPGLDAAARGSDALAQELARRARGGADLVLWVVDARRAGEAEALAHEARALAGGAPVLGVWNQVDREGAAAAPPPEIRCSAAAGWVAVSGARGSGLDALRAEAARWLGLGAAQGGKSEEESARERNRGAAPTSPGGGGGGGVHDLVRAGGRVAPREDSRAPAPTLSRELAARHRRALAVASESVERARELLRARAPLDVAAEALREATDALDGITGRTTPEDVLDRIFGRFCIGK
jgi:tRNA modification GTPase